MILQEDGQNLASVVFKVFPDSQIFKIDSIVDPNCQRIETFTSDSGGDKYVLQNWGTLTINIKDKIYSLRLEYNSGMVLVNDFRKVKK